MENNSRNTQNNNEESREYEQICVYKTGKALVEAMDMLDIEKVKLNILDYSKGTGENTVFVTANIDKVVVQILCTKVLHNVSFGTPQPNGSKILISETKILGHKVDSQTGLSPVTTLRISENAPTMNLKYSIYIENGFGKKNTTQTGGTSIARGSYEKKKANTILLSELDMNKFLMKLQNKILIKDLVEAMKK